MNDENRDGELFPAPEATEPRVPAEPRETIRSIPVPPPPEDAAVSGKVIREGEVIPEEKLPEVDAGGAGSCGEFLRLQRERLGYSVGQVFEETKIKPEIITALEAEDFSRLPGPVYIIAYVKRLCRFYNVDNVLARDFLDRLRGSINFDVPADLSKSVKGSDVSSEHLRRMRNLALIAAALILLLLLLIGTGVTLVVMNLRRSGGPLEKRTEFSEKTLLELQPKPRLKITEVGER